LIVCAANFIAAVAAAAIVIIMDYLLTFYGERFCMEKARVVNLCGVFAVKQ